MADVLDVLHHDHQRLSGRLDRLLDASHERAEEHLRVNELAQELVMAACGHEAVEEMHVWPVVRRLGGAGLSATGLAQELQAERVLSRLCARTPEDGDFDPLLRRFAGLVADHIRFEEEEVWPVLASALDVEERLRIGGDLERSRHTAPTRPHPAVPQTPRAMRTVGVVTGILDRAFDAFSGRGRPFAGQQIPPG